MDEQIKETRIRCPFCDERLDIVIDTSAGDQSYIEDCQVCCQPIQVTFRTTFEGLVEVEADCAS